MIADEARGAGKIERGLGDVVARIGFDLAGELLALACRRLRADQHAVAAAFAHRLHHQLVEVGQHMLALFLFAQQEGLHVGQDGIFVEVVADHVGHVGVDRLVVGEAGAEGVGHGDVAGAIGVEQARAAERRIGAEDERIAEVVVDAAIDDVDALEAVGGAHVDDVVVGDQVAAFDQIDAHLAGEVGVLEVGGVEDARREQHDIRLGAALGRQRAQRGQQQLRIVLDGAHAVAVKELRERCAS
jgi:hypothetical protein